MLNNTEIALANNHSASSTSSSSSSTSTGITPGDCETRFVPTAMCTARCDPKHEPPVYVAGGYQAGVDACHKAKSGADVALPNRDCHELCDHSLIVPGRSPQCIVQKWSDCSANCTQSRVSYADVDEGDGVAASSGKKSNGNGVSGCGVRRVETRKCYVGACPMSDGDFLVIIDMKVQIPSALWSYAYTNTFEVVLAEMFKVMMMMGHEHCHDDCADDEIYVMMIIMTMMFMFYFDDDDVHDDGDQPDDHDDDVSSTNVMMIIMTMMNMMIVIMIMMMKSANTL